MPSRNLPAKTGSKAQTVKRCGASKRWCFTLNNYTEDEVEMLKNINPDIYVKLGFQSEVGAEGTKHLQGFIEFVNRKRPLECLRWTKRFHWEKMKGTIAENVQYITKTSGGGWDGNIRFIRGFDAPYKGPQIVLRDWQKRIDDILKKKPDDRSIYWVWSEAGNVGKTTFAKWIFHNHNDVVVTGGKAEDMKHGILQYLEKNSRLPKIVLVDIPRVNQGHFSIAGIESIKNMFFYCGKYEGGMISGDPPHVVCFANIEPEYHLMSRDRWYIWDVQSSTDWRTLK